MSKAMMALLATALLAAGADDPPFVTSDPNGGWSTGGYYVHNNMWNSAKYSPCTSTLHARSHDNWDVVTRMNNKKGDGAVKTYPNVHKDYRPRADRLVRLDDQPLRRDESARRHL